MNITCILNFFTKLTSEILVYVCNAYVIKHILNTIRVIQVYNS